MSFSEHPRIHTGLKEIETPPLYAYTALQRRLS